MLNFIKDGTKGSLLNLVLLAIAGISIGCATKAETSQVKPPAEPKKETIAATQTPGERIERDPYSERRFEDDFEYSTPAPQKSAVILSKSAYEKIKIGMPLEEVEKLLGEKGMLVSTMDVNGRKTQIYKWTNDNFTSYIDVTLEGGKVVEKKDKNLK